MAIGTVVWGSGVGISGGTGSIAVPYPASPSAGDMLLLCVYTRTNDSSLWGTGTGPTDAGWSELFTSVATANGSYGVYYKTADGTETGTISFTVAVATNSTFVALMAKVPGAATSSPLDSTVVSETEVGGTTYSNGGCSNGTANSLIVFLTGMLDCVSDGDTDGQSGWTGGSLSWAGTSYGDTAGTDATISVGTAIKASTGATGTLTVTNKTGLTTVVGVSCSFAIKESRVFTNTQTESVTATDVLANRGSFLGRWPAETATATDDYSAGKILKLVEQLESVSATDSLDVGKILRTVEQIESVTATDTLNVGNRLRPEEQTEVVTATDDYLFELFSGGTTYNEGQEETVTATDVLDFLHLLGSSLAESVTATDEWGVLQAHVESGVESVTASDSYDFSIITSGPTTYNEGQIEVATASDLYSGTTIAILQQRLRLWNGSSWV